MAAGCTAPSNYLYTGKLVTVVATKKIDDTDVYLGYISEVCTFCRHLHNNGVGRKCRAFEAIPEQIWRGESNHRKHYKGDNGIRFEQIGG